MRQLFGGCFLLPLFLLASLLLLAHLSGAARPKQYNRATIDEPHGFFSQLDSLSLKDNSIWNTKDTYLLSKKGLVAAPVENEDENNEVDLIRKSSISGDNLLFPSTTYSKPQPLQDGPVNKRDEIPEIPIIARGGIFSSLLDTVNAAATPESDDDEAGSSEGSGAPDESIKRELMLIVPNSGDNSDISQDESEGGDSGSGDGETSIDNNADDSSISGGGGGGGAKESASVEESGSASERSVISAIPRDDVPYVKVDDNVILGEGISTKNKRETNSRPRFVVRNGYVYMKVPSAA